MFSPGGKAAGGTLHVAIKDAKALPNMDKDGKTDGFVKLYLLPEKNPKGKRKTTTIKNDLNPVWEEKFTYDKVSADDLSTARALEVTVWDYDRGSSNKFVGGLRIGPTPHHVRKRLEWMDSNQEEASHWTAILASPGQWVERLHSLRASMDPRDIDLSDLSSFLAAEGEEESKEEVGGIRIQAVPELKSEGVGTEGEEAGITLSAIARAAEGVGKEEEFRKVSVGDHTGNPPDSSRHGDGSPPTSEVLNIWGGGGGTTPVTLIKRTGVIMEKVKQMPLEEVSINPPWAVQCPVNLKCLLQAGGGGRGGGGGGGGGGEYSHVVMFG